MMDFRNMNVGEILSKLPSSILDDLAVETKINRYSKKLQGQVLFKLLIHCILTNKENSLRSMASAYESIGFGLLQPSTSKETIRYNSISERISNINYKYFEKIFYACVDLFGNIIGHDASKLIKFDSTIVATSGKLLKIGYHLHGSSQHLRQLKYTIGFADIPLSADVYSEQTHTSENVALRESILAHPPLKTNAIRVFDQGITARKTFDKLTREQIPFISRITVNCKHEIKIENSLSEKIKTNTLIIFSDSWIHLFDQNTKKTEFPLRCIKAKKKSDDEELWFITNIEDLNVTEITDLYKRRWEIEIFFRFLKQELNLSHLINRSENGVRVILYATLIAAILLLVYKKSNNLSGYKIMRQQFLQELEKCVVRDFVIMTGGDPLIFDRLVHDST